MEERNLSAVDFRRCIASSIAKMLIIFAVAIRGVSDIKLAARGVDFFHDDAYYYTIVARNFVASGKMTFDGISQTNGYHPLWFWMQVALFKLGASRLSPTGQYIAIVTLEWIILTLGLAMTFKWLRGLSDRTCQAAFLMGLTILAYPKHLSVFALGMESTLLVMLIPLFLILVWGSRERLAGLIGLLLVMARLDSLVYVVFPVSVYCAWRKRWSPKSMISSGAWVGFPALAGVIVLMASYYFGFGHPIPIHGVLRSSFPYVRFQPHLFFQPVIFARESGNPSITLGMFHLPTSLLILPICGFFLSRDGFLEKAQRTKALLLVFLGIVQLLAFLFFQKWAKGVSAWYLAPLVIFSSGAVAAAMTNLLGKRRTLQVCLLLSLMVALLSGLREYRRGSLLTTSSQVYEFIKSQPSDALWAATDCGSIAFWTGAAFVNLDGLINGFDYQDVLRRKDLSGYLDRLGVDYLVVGAWERAPHGVPIEPMYVHRVDPALYRGDYEIYRFFVYSYMYDCYSDTLTLTRNQEVWRSSPLLDGTIPARTVIFALGGKGRNIP